ncbi:hypothetical protein DFS34DRAFT_626648 [Phlyctochytrium arcticum]|nr:hypothetical protein DFS34DRAFT_626648 [Phlyctochytrium arcticum]
MSILFFFIFNFFFFLFLYFFLHTFLLSFFSIQIVCILCTLFNQKWVFSYTVLERVWLLNPFTYLFAGTFNPHLNAVYEYDLPFDI